MSSEIPDIASIRKQVRKIVKNRDVKSDPTPSMVRSLTEKKLELAAGTLDVKKKEIRQIIDECLVEEKEKAESDDECLNEKKENAKSTANRKRKSEPVAVSKKKKRSESPSPPPSTFDLGKRKKVNVRTFNKLKLIDIREFYEDKDGQEKPGRKGISLTVDQWEKLKSLNTEIDESISNLQ